MLPQEPVSQITPLYGHISESTAYIVDSYPYGGSRCRARFWIESAPKKGFRFVMQTENPHKLIWNKPRKGTYSLFALAMYLDEKSHVHYKDVNQYTSAATVLDFIKTFPNTDISKLIAWVHGKKVYCQARLDDRIPGLKIKSDIEREGVLADKAIWQECIDLLKTKVQEMMAIVK